MFFSKQSVGIHIQDHQVVMVSAGKKEEGIMSLESVTRIPLPEGAVLNEIIMSEDAVRDALKQLKQNTEAERAIMAIPSIKCFSGLMSFPLEMDDETLNLALQKKASTVVPCEFSELEVQTKPIRGYVEGKVLLAYASIQKSVIAYYKNLAMEAGFKEVDLVLDTLALARALPVDYASFERHLFVYGLHNGAYLGSVFHGVLFDAVRALQLEEDFKGLYDSYFNQSGHCVQRIIFSGRTEAMSAIQAMPLVCSGDPEIIPQLVQAQFAVVAPEGDNIKDLPVATGLVSSEKALVKNNGLLLLDLLD